MLRTHHRLEIGSDYLGLEHQNNIDAETFGFAPETKSQPSAAGSIWEGGAAA